MNLDNVVMFTDINGKAVMVDNNHVLERLLSDGLTLYGFNLPSMAAMRYYLIKNGFSIHDPSKLIKELRNGKESRKD